MSDESLFPPKDYYWPVRWLSKLYAQANHYFWLPCNACGENFGGHEWGGVSLHIGRHGRGEMVCAKSECIEYAKKWNAFLEESGLVNRPPRTYEEFRELTARRSEV